MKKNKLKNILIFIVIIILCIYGFKKITNMGSKFTSKDNLKVDCEHEWDNLNDKDKKIIKQVISLAKKKLGTEYVWGGKGEIITEERYNELVKCYGESYYPLDKKDYIGKQGFDCSGLTYWTYKTVTGVNIGYSTIEQQEVLKDYKVDIKDIQPGDLIFTTRHVVMYMGRGKIIHSASRNPYPIGGIKTGSIKYFTTGQVYRPISYINLVKTKK